MEKHLPFLRSLMLFRGIDDEDILQLLEHFQAHEMHFDRNEIIWEPMDTMPNMMIVLDGMLLILQEDWRGNRSIMGGFGPGDFVTESVLGVMDGVLPFCVSVRTKATLLLLDNAAVLNPCGQGCRSHLLLLRNIVDALIQKEMRLIYKIEYLSKRTTREKLMSYFTIQAARVGSHKFDLPYTRQEMADFLSVDRSAMCTELTRMQNDGLIRYDRRFFELLGKK